MECVVKFTQISSLCDIKIKFVLKESVSRRNEVAWVWCENRKKFKVCLYTNH